MYDNKTLNRLTAALSTAGFLITKFSKRPWSSKIKLQLLTKHGKLENPETPETTNSELERRHVGERSDLTRYLRAQDWRHAFSLSQEVLRSGDPSLLNIGDFIRVEFDVPAAKHDGVLFPALHVDGKVQIIEVVDGKIIFNFDEIIFLSAINAKDVNEGGIHASALGKYLNTEFLDAFGIGDVLLACNGTWEKGKEHKISLLTAYELFGDEDYWEPESNYFDEPQQFSFFKKIKNRIKVWEDDTHWYWTASARASSAAYFCICGYHGYCSRINASAAGGVAPVFCVA